VIEVLDIVIIFISFILLIIVSVQIGKNQTSSDDYFLGKKDMPWWAISGSIVATETSTLTFIGVPAISFFGNLNFIQLLFGYIIARIIVAKYFLPEYLNGNIKTSYEYLSQNYGERSKQFTSILFLLTRILGDGVRLFATAVPLKLMTGWSYELSILTIMLVTIIFSTIGGIKAIVWTDFTQLMIYLLGAIICLIWILSSDISFSLAPEKLNVFNFDFSISNAYSFFWAFFGGILLSISSHGTDQLLVQRALLAKNLKDAQKAMISSGIFVFFQIVLFLAIGLLLVSFYNHELVSFSSSQRNEIFPYFIINYIPTGLKGFIIASLFAAAISTLSSSVNSMASVSQFNLSKDKENSFKKSRIYTVIWGLVLCAFAILMKNDFAQKNVVSLGLAVASIIYGGMLSGFILNRFNVKLKTYQFISSISLGIIAVLVIWIYQISSGNTIIAWTLFIPIGMFISLSCAYFFRMLGSEKVS
jgi:solute:Na+ symporter, SSS family